MILPADLLSAVFRVLVVLLVYLFLYQVIRALVRDLRASAVSGPPVLHLIPVNGRAARPIVIRGRATIGRGPDSDVCISDEYLSAEHAAIYWRNGGWWISDLGSTNGTLHNGHPVTEDAAMRPGDVVQLGGLQFRVGSTEAA